MPPGTVSVIDPWEPHAAEDPVAQRNPSHYDVLYVSRARWDAAADASEARRRLVRSQLRLELAKRRLIALATIAEAAAAAGLPIKATSGGR